MEARQMTDEIDSEIPTKKCTGCKEDLAYDQFYPSTQPKHFDGYRNRCKGCEKGTNAKSYQNMKAGYPDHIIPKLSLREHNLSTLSSYINGEFVGTYFVFCKAVNYETRYELVLVFNGDKWTFKMLDSHKGLVREFIGPARVGWTSFSRGMLDLLLEMEVKILD